MKILAFVDLHGNMKMLDSIVQRSRQADLVLCAGDISNFEHNLDKLLKKLNTAYKPVIIIPGNHEGEEYLEAECNKYENLIYLHKGLFQLEDLTIVGYGSGGFASKDSRFESFTRRIEKHVSGKLVLLTHGPPYGNKLDFIYGEHCGNKSYNKFIKRLKPVLAISGHLHETAGAEDSIGITRLANPGPRGKIFLI